MNCYLLSYLLSVIFLVKIHIFTESGRTYLICTNKPNTQQPRKKCWKQMKQAGQFILNLELKYNCDCLCGRLNKL